MEGLPVHDGGRSCSLDGQGAAERDIEFADLARRGLDHRRRLPDGRIELTFDASTVGEREVRALVHREQQCCYFFTFEVLADHDEIRVTVDAPASKRDYLDLIDQVTMRDGRVRDRICGP